MNYQSNLIGVQMEMNIRSIYFWIENPWWKLDIRKCFDAGLNPDFTYIFNMLKISSSFFCSLVYEKKQNSRTSAIYFHGVPCLDAIYIHICYTNSS